MIMYNKNTLLIQYIFSAKSRLLVFCITAGVFNSSTTCVSLFFLFIYLSFLPTELFQHLRMNPFVSLAIRVLLHSDFRLFFLSSVIKDDGNDTVYGLRESSNFFLDPFKIHFKCMQILRM